MSQATPLTQYQRVRHYLDQSNGRALTPRQERRADKKENQADRRAMLRDWANGLARD